MRKGPADDAVNTPHAVFELENAFRPNGFVDDRHHVRLVIGVNVFCQPGAAGCFGVGEEMGAMQMSHLAPIGAHAIHHI